MGPECTKYHKRLAELIANKRNESYADVMNFIRTKIRFSILKCTLVAIRGERGKKWNQTSTSDVSLNTVPTTKRRPLMLTGFHQELQVGASAFPIPRQCAKVGQGYLEVRPPASNCNPYKVA